MDRLASAFQQALWKCLCMQRFCISLIASSKYITAEVGHLRYKWPNWTPGHFPCNFYHVYNKWNMGLKFSSIYFFSASLNHAFFFGVLNALPVTLRSRLERNSIPNENYHSPTSGVSVFPNNLISREGYFSVSYFRTQPGFGNCEDIQIIVFEERSNGIHLVRNASDVEMENFKASPGL